MTYHVIFSGSFHVLHNVSTAESWVSNWSNENTISEIEFIHEAKCILEFFKSANVMYFRIRYTILEERYIRFEQRLDFLFSFRVSFPFPTRELKNENNVILRYYKENWLFKSNFGHECRRFNQWNRKQLSTAGSFLNDEDAYPIHFLVLFSREGSSLPSPRNIFKQITNFSKSLVRIVWEILSQIKFR